MWLLQPGHTLPQQVVLPVRLQYAQQDQQPVYGRVTMTLGTMVQRPVVEQAAETVVSAMKTAKPVQILVPLNYTVGSVMIENVQVVFLMSKTVVIRDSVMVPAWQGMTYRIQEDVYAMHIMHDSTIIYYAHLAMTTVTHA